MPWIQRRASDVEADAIAALIVAMLLLMVVAAEALQSTKHEELPRTAMRLDVVSDGCGSCASELSAPPTARLDLQLMSSAVSPRLQLIPVSPSSRARCVRVASVGHRIIVRSIDEANKCHTDREG
jgi:hypothetical protein